MVNITKYETSVGVRWRVRYRKPNGQQTDKRGFTKKIDAERWAAANITTAIADGRYVDPSFGHKRVGPLAIAWLDKKRVILKPSSMKSLDTAYRTYIEPKWGSYRIDAVTREALQTWITGLIDGSATPDGKPKGRTTICRCLEILRGVFGDAVADGMLTLDPTLRLETPRRSGSKRQYLTAEELYRLAASAGWRGDIILFLGLTGLRWGEMAALQVRDVDLVKHRILVSKSATQVGNRFVLGSTKTGEARKVMYPQALQGMLESRCVGDPDGLVFPNRGRLGVRPFVSHRDAHRDGRWGWLDYALSQAGIDKRVGVHDLRHTAASLMIKSGANVKVIQRQLGHASAAMTLDIYADLFDDDLDSVAAKMDDLVKNVGKMWANRIPEPAATTA